ncbi:MAG: 16S rRNA (uracil(1498)-N(3))-methyltransferase [Gammaproteobacteria bacterium]|nr:16S rRNA (uracil(1498)-N(3))-methyltransferase [Gammaproteobacteria bacterium]
MPKRIYHPGTYQTGDILTLPETIAHHLNVVLRKKIGEQFLLIPGDLMEWEAEIITIDKKKLTVKIGKGERVNRASPLHIHLAQSIGKGEKFDFIVQKAVELGVAELTPIISSRSAFSTLEKKRLEKKHLHWQAIIISAVEQCGRTELPVLHPICEFDQFIAQTNSSQKLILTPHTSYTLSEKTLTHPTITLLIGPEGGWSDSEYQQATTAGCLPVTLGPRILRTETAPIAIISILQALKGDLLSP